MTIPSSHGNGRNDVVITGIGVVAPNGIGKDAFWSSLLERRSGIGPVTLFDASDLPCRIAGEVRDFDADTLIGRSARRMARASQFAVVAAGQAIADAGLEMAWLRRRQLPVVMGVSTSAMDLIAETARPWTAVAAVPHAVTSAVVYAHELNARMVTISDGCSSGVDSVAHGAAEIASGRSEIALAGSSDGSVARYVFECFSRARKLSTRNDEPQRSDRPFDRDRDGGVISEAAGMVVLESLPHALARGARPYAVVRSWATASDPCGGEEGAGLAHTMAMAVANAGCTPAEVDHVSAHGPGDEQMDRFETGLIRNLLGGRAFDVPVTSIKGATGNPMAAGGMLQILATALAIREETLPPTTNLETPGAGCDLDYVPGAPRAARIRRALVNTHGFGRGNTSMVLERTGC